jgi:hypothetical protein
VGGIVVTYSANFDSAGTVPSVAEIASALDPNILTPALTQAASQSTVDVIIAYRNISLSVPSVAQTLGSATTAPSSAAFVNSISTSSGSQSSDATITSVAIIIGCLLCIGMVVGFYAFKSRSKSPSFELPALSWPDVASSGLDWRSTNNLSSRVNRDPELVEWPSDLLELHNQSVDVVQDAVEDIVVLENKEFRAVRKFNDEDYSDWPDDLFVL